MIKSLKINRFKLFDSLLIKNFSRITLIGGKNNVGKTSLLEALFTFYDRSNPKITLRQLSWRGVHSVPLIPEAVWAPIFKDFDFFNPIDIEVDDSKKRERLRIRYNSKYQKEIRVKPPVRPDSPPQIFTEEKPTSTVALDFIYYVNNREKGKAHVVLDIGQIGIDIDKLVKAKNAIFFASGVPRNPNTDAERFGVLDIHGQVDYVVDVMKIIEPKLKSLSSITQWNTSMIHGDIGLAKKIPVPYMGEGTVKLLSYVLAIASNENGIVLIDEFENGLHYSLLPEVWQVIAKTALEYKCQVILTTHSYETIKAMTEGLSNDQMNHCSYIRLDREKDDIVPKSYTSDMLQSAIDREWEIR